MSRKSFIQGALILGIAGIISKFVGAVFRIPLTNIIAGEGIGLYHMAYPIYVTLLTVSSAGIPVAISKLVSENIALGRRKEAHRIFSVSLRLLIIIGILSTLALLIIAPIYTSFINNQKALYPLLAIAPGLFIVAIMAAYRGYFQGMQIMLPTALSQIVEQLGKLGFGLLFAILLIPRGPEYGATGAIIGVIIAEVFALGVLLILYAKKKRSLNLKNTSQIKNYQTSSMIMKRILRIAVPITLGAAVIPLVNMADLLVIPWRLNNLGFVQEEATALYGYLSGYSNTLINFPQVVTLALAMSLVPAISEAAILKDHQAVRQKTLTGIRITILLGLPSSVGLFLLARPILEMLYSRAFQIENAIANPIQINTQILQLLAFGVIFLTLVQTTTAALQGIGKILVPVRNLAIGAGLKLIINYTLVGIPELNIKGAAIGTIICYAVAAILNFYEINKHIRIDYKVVDSFIKPVIASLIMGVVVIFTYNTAFDFLASGTKATLLSILSSGLVYVLMLFSLGAIKYNDFRVIPGGEKTARLLKKIKLLRE